MRGLRRLSSLAAVAAVALAAQFAAAQVLNQVPGNAMVVVKVANLQKTSDKIASLSQKLGIAQMVPQMADPIGALEQKLNSPKGINREGEMAFVYVDPAAVGGDDEKAFLVLLPVSDYGQFVQNFKGAKAEGDVTQGTVPDSGETVFIGHWGDYAALAPAKELVAAKPQQALQVQGIAAKEMQEKDVVAYVNFAQVRTKALPALAKNRQRILNQIQRHIEKQQGGAKAAEGEGAAADAAAKPANPQSALAVRTMVNQGLNLVQEFLQDTQAVTWGLNFADDGIKSSLVSEFDPKTYLGQLAGGSKNTDQPLLAGLPGGNYLLYGGMKIDPERSSKLVDDISQPVIKELKAAGVETSSLETYVVAMKQMYGASESMTMGLVAPGGQLGQEALFQTVGVMTGDADKLAVALRDSFQSQAGLMKLVGQPEDQTKVSFTANAKTVEGVAFDQFQTQFNFTGNTPEEMQAQQMINLMYGPNGMNMYSGKVDEKHLLVVSGGSDELIAKGIAAAKSNENTLGALEQVKAVDAQLPQSRLAVFYIPVDNMITTGLAYAKQFGMPIQVQLPPNLPPIGATVSSEGSAYRVDGYVPAQLVQSLIAAGMQAFMAVQGGGAQPGGPGGL